MSYSLGHLLLTAMLQALQSSNHVALLSVAGSSSCAMVAIVVVTLTSVR